MSSDDNRSNRLIWIDLEMTGLDTGQDSIIEIATVVTDSELNVLAEGPEFAIAHPVSVLEAMAHGCIPLLSDLPANRELVQDRQNGWIVPQEWGVTSRAQEDVADDAVVLPALLAQAAGIAAHNRNWVRQHGLFPSAVQQLMQILQSL